MAQGFLQKTGLMVSSIFYHRHPAMNLNLSASEVPFGALLTYSPRGDSEMSQSSRKWCYGIKNDAGRMIETAVSTISDKAKETLGEFFEPDSILVPAPRSSPVKPGGHWSPLRICEELAKAGYGEVKVWLERSESVTKSSTAGIGSRPSAQDHVATINPLEQGDLLRRKIIVVDDVITKGSTSFACAKILEVVFPNSEVKVFSMIRTMGLIPDVEGVLDPCRGVLRFDGNKVDRTP